MAAQKQGGFHYAWIITILGMLMVFTTVGIIMTSFSAVYPYMNEAWGLTNSQSGSLTTIRTIVNMIGLFFTAAFYKKLTLRWGCTIGILFSVLGYVILATGSQYWQGALAMSLFGLSRAAAGMVGVSALINNWYNINKATMLGLCSATSGFTTFIMPPILSSAIEGHDFHYACWLVAGILTVIMVLVALLCRDTPDQMGLAKYGAGQTEEAKPKKQLERNYDFSKTGKIMMLVVAGITATCYAHGQFNTLNLTTAGWEKADAARALSYYGLCLMIGKFLYGVISDHLKQKWAATIFYGAMTIAFIILANVRFAWFTMPVAILTFGIYCIGGAAATNGLSTFALDVENTNPEAYNRTVKNYNVAYNLISAIMVWIAGISADMTGGYSVAYWSMVILDIIAIILIHVSYNEAAKRYKEAH